MFKLNEGRTYVSDGADSDSLEAAPGSNDGLGSGHGEPSPADGTLGDSERMAQEMFRVSEQPDLASGRHDYRTGTMTAGVIALSVLLGWMVGRAGWNMAVNRAQAQSPEVSEEVLAATPVTSYPLLVSPRAEELTDLAKPIRSAPILPPTNATPKSKNKAVQPDGALVMYESGEVVFGAAGPSKATSPTVNQGGAVQAGATGESDSPAASDPNLHPATDGHLLARVVPNYPEDARRQRIEGPVVLNALVGTDGSVRELKVISGNPQLVQAATEAVRQWRFQPHRLKGEPAEFETQITVNFSLR
jgi:TonB family protein